MKRTTTSLLFVLALLSAPAWAQDTTETALSCQDFNPTEEAIQRFPDLAGACEAVVDRDGELYGRFTAIVRRVSYSSVILYLPATDHTFTVNPEQNARAEIEGRKMRPRDLLPGQEIQIYLSARQFSTPDIEEVALVTESDVILDHPVAAVAALPTTASPWPSIALLSLVLLGAGALSRRHFVVNSGSQI